MHTHTREDEWTFVLDGDVGVRLREDDHVARPGDLVLKPRLVPHAFWNAGDRPARVLEVITPGGFEQYFSALGAILGSAGPPDGAALDGLAQRFGVEMDLSSVPRLVQEHGLALP